MTTLPESVSVIGAGSWGTALAMVVSKNITQVRLWGRNAAHVEEMVQQRCNSRYLPDIILPNNLSVEADFQRMVDHDLAFLVVVPSHGFRSTIETIRRHIIAAGFDPGNATVVWGTKGFDPGSGSLLSEVIHEVFEGQGRHAAVSGPSFAAETAKSLPTALTVASRDQDVAEAVARWFRTPTTRVYFSSDLVGVQLGGAIKNVMAIAAGISDGLGYGANARAALITRGLTELTRLGVALGGNPDTFMGLTGVGDLILTCTDDQSRNRRFGIGVGAGKSRQQICDEIGQEIEGINTTRELYMVSRKLNVEMPITEQVYRILHQGYDPKTAVQELLRRDPKAEHHKHH